VWEKPALTWLKKSPPATATGVNRRVVVPSPSPPVPQQYARFKVVSAQVWNSPVVIRSKECPPDRTRRKAQVGLAIADLPLALCGPPDGHGRVELTKFRNPRLVEIEPAVAPPNTLGLQSVMFTVESIDDTVARLRANGAELLG
jgi:hypothetical protein